MSSFLSCSPQELDKNAALPKEEQNRKSWAEIRSILYASLPSHFRSTSRAKRTGYTLQAKCITSSSIRLAAQRVPERRITSFLTLTVVHILQATLFTYVSNLRLEGPSFCCRCRYLPKVNYSSHCVVRAEEQSLA